MAFDKKEYEFKLKTEISKIYFIQGKLTQAYNLEEHPLLKDIYQYLSDCASRLNYKIYKLSQED